MLIAVAGLKGGIGKTTVTLHLAGEAFARGMRVLVVDADVQRSALTWADVATEAKQAAPLVVAMSSALHKQLPPLAKDYDLTIVDAPPRGDVLTRAALMVVDLVLLPTGPAPTDFWALQGTMDLLEQAQALRPELQARLLLNRLQPRQRLSATARDALGSLGAPVLEASLGMRTAFAESLAGGQTVATFAPGSAAAIEVRALLDEIGGGRS